LAFGLSDTPARYHDFRLTLDPAFGIPGAFVANLAGVHSPIRETLRVVLSPGVLTRCFFSSRPRFSTTGIPVRPRISELPSRTFICVLVRGVQKAEPLHDNRLGPP
jgi:hypothetical protein